MKVIFCLPGNSYTAPFFASWNRLMFWMKENDVMPIIAMSGGSNISKVRDRCLRPPRDKPPANSKLPLYGDVNYDYIMMIDSDIHFLPDDFQKLLDRDEDIVSGAYKMDPDNYCGMLVRGNSDLNNATYISEEDLKGKDLLESLYAGMGFMLVKKGVFETVKWPWFLSTTIPFVNRAELMVSEDIYFCNKAREAGYKVWIDPTVKVGHQRQIVI